MDLSVPNHVAIIPDGNRRWAKEKGLPSLEGHRQGMEAAVNIARAARELGIHTLTFWAFSTENWTRTKDEVAGIVSMGSIFIDRYTKEAVRDQVKIIHIGRKDRMPSSLLKKMTDAEGKTKQFDKYILNIAFDYGGRDEVLRAIQKLNQEPRTSNQELTEQDFAQFLDTAGQPYPNPDLIIRTSGEQRTSGLMIWQAAYAEYLFVKKYFPEFNKEDLKMAIEDYSNRQRRFGN
ncbi:MAG TPA: polyprenyl diphosphate synthase [Patescibacteria group bacterium]|nr:polyprenyl diphosphate synthase [Patescibacteria group bacterium]